MVEVPLAATGEMARMVDKEVLMAAKAGWVALIPLDRAEEGWGRVAAASLQVKAAEGPPLRYHTAALHLSAGTGHPLEH